MPPSTLAAQLVETIPAPTRQLWLDEEPELQRLFCEIEKVKDAPRHLQTQEERIEHNHMLIYVCALVFLGGNTKKVPTASPDGIPLCQTNVLNAVQLVHIAVQETPAVLEYRQDQDRPGSFVHRGDQKLFLWLLPKVLRWLGHRHCLPATEPIEELLVHMVAVTSENPDSDDLALAIMRYLRLNFLATTAHVEKRNRPRELNLPLPRTLEHLFEEPLERPPVGCGYTIDELNQATRHATSLLLVLSWIALPSESSGVPEMFAPYTPFVLEFTSSLSRLRADQPVLLGHDLWRVSEPILKAALIYDDCPRVDHALLQNTHIALLSLCCEIIKHPVPLVTASDYGLHLRQTVCISLVELAKGALRYKGLSGLINSRLVKLMEDFLRANSYRETSTLIARCFRLTRDVASGLAESGRVLDCSQEEFGDTWLFTRVRSLVEAFRNSLPPLGLSPPVRVPGRALGEEQAIARKSPVEEVPEWVPKEAEVMKESAAEKILPSRPSRPPPLPPFFPGQKLALTDKESTLEKTPVPSSPPAEQSEASERAVTLKEVLEILRGYAGPGAPGGLAVLEEPLLLHAFPRLDDDQKGHVLKLLSQVSCAADNCLLCLKGTEDTFNFVCWFCKGAAFEDQDPHFPLNYPELKRMTADIFFGILDLPSFRESGSAQEIAMICLRRLLRHSHRVAAWTLDCPAGRLCLASLQSESTELRFLAGRTMMEFLRPTEARGLGRLTVEENQSHVMGVLKEASKVDDPQLRETLIWTWGSAGRVVSGDNLNLVLIELVKYLGHPSTFAPRLAASEILSLAESRGWTPRKLFAPFWKHTAFFVLKDHVSRPQASELIAKILQIDVPNLLLLLQNDALPWLVVWGKRDVIKKIAEARGETEAWRPCMDSANLPRILALLLLQEAEDVPGLAMQLLRAVSRHFYGFGFDDLLRTEPLLTVLEFLKITCEDGAFKDRARPGLLVMANLLTPAGALAENDDDTIISRFLEGYIMGLTPRLSDVINDSRSVEPPMQERRAHIKALEEILRLCKSSTRVSRPQISACLMDAMAFEQLRQAAFSCWAAMVIYMEDEDVEALIEATFFIIREYWQTLDATSKATTERLLLFLNKTHGAIVERYAYRLPSIRGIDGLADYWEVIERYREPIDERTALEIFMQRLSHENGGVVLQALRELAEYLHDHQSYLQTSAISEQPDSVVTGTMRTLLDCLAKYNGVHADITRLCAECIGMVGCLDSNRLEADREQRQFVVVHDFDDIEETQDFTLFLLDKVLVKAFLSATDTRFQGYLAYVMQELLAACDIRDAYSVDGRENLVVYSKWMDLPEATRDVLTPFLTSMYFVAPVPPQQTQYPVFRPGKPYRLWLRTLVLDLLQNGRNMFGKSILGPNVFGKSIFGPLCRAILVKDPSIAEFLLPYISLHMVLADEEGMYAKYADYIRVELLSILRLEPRENASYAEREGTKSYYEAVFRVHDYFMRWLQLKKSPREASPEDAAKIRRVEELTASLNPELLSKSALYCNQYARALFFLEPLAKKEQQEVASDGQHRLTESLQHIYSQIDDPDSLEGFAVSVRSVDLNLQTQSHRKAGRWAAVQNWYEIRHTESPEDVDIQLDLLTCLKDSGQHDVLLSYVEEMRHTPDSIDKLASFAVEASWTTGKWEMMEKYLNFYSADITENFNLGIAQALLSLRRGDLTSFREYIHRLRDKVAASMSYSVTSSLRSSHDAMLKCHVLSELEMISSSRVDENGEHQSTLVSLNRRLEMLGAYVGDKQYILAVRRAAMELLRPSFQSDEISSLWLSSAKLARKAGSTYQSFNAVLHAQKLGDPFAQIENAKLLWNDGHHRKAIQMLEGAMKTQLFGNVNPARSLSSAKMGDATQATLLTARTHLLLAKWLDATGQTHASALRLKYQEAAKTHPQWEKGHYYLGRHYKKVLESEKMLKPDDQSDEYLSGEMAKLVIENYMRSLNYGTKYLYQTLPRILTLWLEMGAHIGKAPDGKGSLARELLVRRKAVLAELHNYLRRHLTRIPAYIFYTALAQMVARIAHPNSEVFNILELMIVKVVEAHPRQALWSLCACMTATTKQQGTNRYDREVRILAKLRALTRSGPVDNGTLDVRQLLSMAERLADQLLRACHTGNFPGNRSAVASLTRDLKFNTRCVPCPLVVPIEACLAATLPTLTDSVKKHKAFSRDVITLESFYDDVLVLGSLARPRRLTAIGSDGKTYNLLIKPKDDLRTDQRLMEFNGMINRSLKRDAESSRRQLYIRTYAVTPLNEECGIIEWVDGLKTLRDILLESYRARGIVPNYGLVADLLQQASGADGDLTKFTDEVLSMFPPVLPEWFTRQFPDPSAWFAARLKYTRSCAVMSMVGTILGLGDRHGENLLLEEGNGGVFHVDFNCLFDKGLTFAQPETVPFRLTHNMTAAMGLHSYEGPFRQCSELTLRVLRQQEETLMTILEAFVHDPTLDLQRDKKRKNEAVRLDPTSVVESIRRKVRGLLPDESIPLGVEGQVEELIRQATDPKNLAAMYIGWCAFF